MTSGAARIAPNLIGNGRDGGHVSKGHCLYVLDRAIYNPDGSSFVMDRGYAFGRVARTVIPIGWIILGRLPKNDGILLESHLLIGAGSNSAITNQSAIHQIAAQSHRA